MSCTFQTNGFRLEYIQSVTDTAVLWESHCHTQFEMISVLEGDISIMLEGRSYRLTENQTVIIPPLFYHTITANKNGLYRRVTALFDLSAIPGVLQSKFEKRGADIVISAPPQIKELKRICQEKETSFYAPLAYSLMVQILYNDVLHEQPKNEPAEDGFLKEIISYIDTHLSEKIKLDDLAKHASRSKSSVCHLFEEKMKISPKQYIIQKKLAFAAKIIRDGTLPTHAAMQIGYDNYSDFYRMYQKCFGTSPTKRIM